MKYYISSWRRHINIRTKYLYPSTVCNTATVY